MGARDDELRERRRGERVERDLRLPGAALDHVAPARPARAPAAAGRAGRRSSRRPQEAPQERLRVARRLRLVHLLALARRTRRPPGRPARLASRAARSRSASGRAPAARAAASSEIDAAVGVPDEVVAGLEQRGDEPASTSKSTRSTGGIGGNPGRSSTRSSKRSASALLRAPRRGRRERRFRGRGRAAPSGHPRPCNEVRVFSAQETENRCYKHADMLRGRMTPDAASSPHSLATASGLLLGALGAAMARRRARRLGARRRGDRAARRRGRRYPARLARRLPGLRAEPDRVSAGIFSTPRPLPSRIGPTIAGATVIALALPIFVVAGWPLRPGRSPPCSGSPREIFALVLARLPGGADNLAAAGSAGHRNNVSSATRRHRARDRHGGERDRRPRRSDPLRGRVHGRAGRRARELLRRRGEGMKRGSLRSRCSRWPSSSVRAFAQETRHEDEASSTPRTSGSSIRGDRSSRSARSTCRSTRPSRTSSSA